MNKVLDIQVTATELEQRINQVNEGDSPERVSGILDGTPFKEENVSGKKRLFWRFYVTDRDGTRQRQEVYLGEFENDRLVFGSVIPQGS